MDIHLHSRNIVPEITISDDFFPAEPGQYSEFINTRIKLKTAEGEFVIQIIADDALEITDNRQREVA